MTNLGYILNFSSNYNANNFLYYYLPSISSGHILLFDKLTKTPIPNNEHFQEEDIKSRIRELKNHWDLYRLNPQNTYELLKINIILDYKPWRFTGFGSYSFMNFAKIVFLKKEFEKHFTPQELSKINFQYLIIKNRFEEEEELAHYLDDKRGQNDGLGMTEFGNVNLELLKWPNWKSLIDCINEKIDITGKKAGDTIGESEKTKLQQNADNVISRFKNSFEVNPNATVLKDFINRKLTTFRKSFLSSFNTFSDLSNENIRIKSLENLMQKFSSHHYLRENKDVVFKFSINSQTIAEKIHGFEALSSFLAESIDFFDQGNEIKFLSCGGGTQIFNISGIQFDEAKRNELFSSYYGYTIQHNEEKVRLLDEKVEVQQHEFNITINPQQYFYIDKELQEKFLTVDNLKKGIRPFFTENKVNQLRKALENNTIQNLEDKAKIGSAKTSTAYDLKGDYGISSKLQEMTIAEIEIQLEHLKKEEENSRLESGVDIKKYEVKKEQYLDKIADLREDFLDSLRLFPDKRGVSNFILTAVLIVLLFGMPLFTFQYWKEAVIYAVMFSSLLLLAGIIVFFIQRSTIISKYDEIYYANLELLTSFKKYVDSLGDLAVNVKKSTLRRKNIMELEDAKSTVMKKIQSSGSYSQFYSELLREINANGHIVTPKNELELPNVLIPPIADIRNKKEIKSNVTIIYKETTKTHEDLKSRLGIIKTIKSH